MIHGEAAPGTFDDHATQHAMIKSTVVFLPLFAPFGISSGYVLVTLGFQLGQAGVPTAVVAGLIALSVWPQTWKMLWALVVDTVGNPKLWYGLGTGIVALTIFLMSLLPATARAIPALSSLVVIGSLASTLVAMASEVFMGHGVAPEMRGRASGWAQAGNLGGSGIGGGLGLALVEHVAQPWVSGAVLALICMACWGAVLAVPKVRRTRETLHYWQSLKGVLLDVWSVARSRPGYLALVLMLLPIGTGAVAWSAIAGEWKAGGNLVALVSGVLGGLVSALGALIGGYICDRINVRFAFCLFGLLAGLAAVIMAWAPRTPEMFAVFVLIYALAVGAGYAGYSAIVLQAIGKRSVATNFSLMAALSNVPIAAMTEFDGWTHDRFGTVAMIYGELAMPLLAVTAFALLVLATRRRARG
jgi:MFS family permease